MSKETGDNIRFFTGVKREQPKRVISTELNDFVEAFEKFKKATDSRLDSLENRVVAERPRMNDAPNAIPEWAMEAATKIWADMGFVNDRINHIPFLARALVSADKAATDKERERCRLIVSERRVWPTSATLHTVGQIIATAIAKGE